MSNIIKPAEPMFDIAETVFGDMLKPENGYCTQQYIDWLKSPENQTLYNRGICLSVNPQTTATPVEIVTEFEAIMGRIQEEYENGTLEYANLDD
jgi:hypothetical protein